MKCLVTGANGFIGYELTKELISRNFEVNVLVRRTFPTMNTDGITVFTGDLWNMRIIDEAMIGCDYVFHLAAYANIWSKDKTLAYRTNVEGTKNILDAALKNKVKKVVFTSSAATLPASVTNELVDETTPLPENYLTEYETTKRQAELLCTDFVKKGLDVVIVQPPRVYGPGFLNKSNSVTIMIKNYIRGIWRIIPGNGQSIGNYVYISDVVQGHVLAAQLGKAGEKYILGGENCSYNEFFSLLSEVSGKKITMFHFPMWLMMLIGKVEFFFAENFGKKPLITPPWVKRYAQNRGLSSQKAENQLGYRITPLKTGLVKTIEWSKEG